MSKIIEFPTPIALPKIEVVRTDAFHVANNKLSEFISTLPLTTEENDALIALIVEQVKEAEQGAFLDGFNFGKQV